MAAGINSPRAGRLPALIWAMEDGPLRKGVIMRCQARIARCVRRTIIGHLISRELGNWRFASTYSTIYRRIITDICGSVIVKETFGTTPRSAGVVNNAGWGEKMSSRSRVRREEQRLAVSGLLGRGMLGRTHHKIHGSRSRPAIRSCVPAQGSRRDCSWRL